MEPASGEVQFSIHSVLACDAERTPGVDASEEVQFNIHSAGEEVQFSIHSAGEEGRPDAGPGSPHGDSVLERTRSAQRKSVC